MAPSSQDGAKEDEEDDYMSMVIADPVQPVKESSMQRRLRRQREGEIKSRAKSKQEKAADEAAARDTALSTALDSSNKGFKMMAKLGYKPGETLGKSEDARTEPIHLSMKEDRGGIGLDSERKRKIREEFEHETKRVKADESDYRERLRAEREAKRLEGQLIGAQKVLEKFETETEADAREIEESSAEDDLGSGTPPRQSSAKNSRLLRSINVLWRGLLRHRLEQERERRMRHDLQQSLTNNLQSDSDEDGHDKQAQEKDSWSTVMLDDLDEEDPELDEFDALPLSERLEKLVLHLREQYNYCFWCKHQYPDSSLEDCPGVKEDEHD